MNDEIDVLPKLLEEVKNEFELAYGESEIIRNAFAKLELKRQHTEPQMILQLRLV